MFNGFLKPAWQSKSIEKRCSAINKMDQLDQKNQAIFSELALNDGSQKVQLACISKLNDPSTLFRLSNSSSDNVIQKAATEALSLCIGPSGSIDTSELNELLKVHPDASLKIIQYAKTNDLRHQLIGQTEQSQLANIVADVAYSETRSFIAETLDDLSALETARKNLKGKDKKAERIIRSKIDLIRNNKKLIEENQLAAQELLNNMTFIAEHPQWRAEFKERFELYNTRWNELQSTTLDDTVNSFELVKQQAQLKVSQQIVFEDNLAQQHRLVTKLETYCCDTLAQLNFEQLKDEQLSINTILADAIASWLDLNKLSTASASLSNQFLQTERALEWLSILISDPVKATEKKSQWPKHYPTLKAYKEAKDQHLSALEEKASTELANKKTLDKLHQRINRLQGTTKKGDLRKTRYELSAVTKAVEKHSGRDRLKLNDRLDLAQQTVAKMEDWHIFATDPKYSDLCEKMEALLTAKNHPDAQASKISDLQKKWKSLGHSSAADIHWPRFKEAADKAYEPCALFFAQRKDTQNDNLQKREPFITQLLELLEKTDWQDSPDYREIEQSLRSIDNKWRAIKDVERQAGQKQWNKFKDLKDKIYVHLDAVYDANIELKKNIIKQVDNLLASDLQDSAIDKLKLLQNRWKQVGITRRKQDQEQWKKFKAGSDAVYHKISAIRNDLRAEQDSQIKSYKDIIQQINSLAKNANSLVQADGELEQLQQQYHSLPALPKELPEKLIEKLDSDFQRALTNVSARRDQLIINAQEQQYELLRLKSDLCSELELAIHNKAKEPEVDKLKDKIKAIELNDKSWEDALNLRISQADKQDKSTANDARRSLCIELEIIKEVDSPSSDKALRMNTQLERMKNQGLGGATLEKKQALNELQIKWCTIEGAEPSIQKELHKRFEGVFNK